MRLIDADALSEKLCETTIFIKDGEVFQRMINDAPTVSAEAVQGELIYKTNDESVCEEWECSKCTYKRLCEEIEVKDLSCDDIKVIAQGSDEVGSLYEICG